MHLLEQKQYLKVRPLFQLLEQLQPMCLSVLEGIYPGSVYVENIEHPDAAVLTTFIENETNGVWAFLAGNPGNNNFNQSLNRAIYDRRVISMETPVVLFTCDTQAWDDYIPAVMAPGRPIRVPRCHFLCREVSYNWRDAIPYGYTMLRMSDNLRRIPGLEIPEDVSATLDKWCAAAKECFQDYGFVIIDETGSTPLIACWATVDFIAHGFGDIGFFTQTHYRRRGLGTIVTAATLEHGFANGLSHVNWTCDADNQASLRTAKKLGLERIDDYMMYVLILDPAQH
jgi:RimJ/RimL family protein N-acetyltransferase